MKRINVTSGLNFDRCSGNVAVDEVLQTFTCEAVAGASQAFASAIARIQDNRKEYYIYETFTQLVGDATVKPGVSVRTLGQYLMSDGGGAEFLIKGFIPDEAGAIRISNNLYALPVNAVTQSYRALEEAC